MLSDFSNPIKKLIFPSVNKDWKTNKKMKNKTNQNKLKSLPNKRQLSLNPNLPFKKLNLPNKKPFLPRTPLWLPQSSQFKMMRKTLMMIKISKLEKTKTIKILNKTTMMRIWTTSIPMKKTLMTKSTEPLKRLLSPINPKAVSSATNNPNKVNPNTNKTITNIKANPKEITDPATTSKESPITSTTNPTKVENLTSTKVENPITNKEESLTSTEESPTSMEANPNTEESPNMEETRTLTTTKASITIREATSTKNID